MKGTRSLGPTVFFLLTALLIVANPAQGARTLPTGSSSGFGQDSDTSSWLISSSTSTVQKILVNQMILCPSVSFDGTTCASGPYEVLVQIPYAPDDLSVTFSGLTGFDGSSFGIAPCPTSTPLQTSVALCTPNPPNNLTVNYTSSGSTTFTLAFGSGNSFFPSTGLTFFISNLTAIPTSPVVTAVSGNAGVALSQTSLAFGSQPGPTTAANSLMQTVILTNGGLATLHVSAVATTGPFTATSNCTSASPLAQGASCGIGVTFTPTAAASGAQTGTLTITDDAPSNGGAQRVISLSGVADNSAVTLDPSAVVFGSQPASTGDFSESAGPPQSVNLTNAGTTSSVAITNVAINGDFCSDLTLATCFSGLSVSPPASTCTNGNTLTVGSSCSIEVSSYPTLLGPAAGSIVITDQVLGHPIVVETHTVALTGFGTSPRLTFDTSNVSFTALNLGSSATASAATLAKSLGAIGLTLDNVVTAAQFGLAHSSTCTAGSTAASCTLAATFTPTTPGLQTGMVVATDNVGNGSEYLALSGTGNGAAVSLSSAALSFPSTLVGSTSAAQTFTLTNTGNAALNISAISPTAGFAMDKNTTTCSTGTAVVAGTQCTIGVTFTPSGAGAASGSLTIVGTGNGVAVTVPAVSLSGTGLAPVASLSAAGLTPFGNQRVGTTSASQPVTLDNAGNAALTISNIAVTADFTQTNNCGTSVAASSSCTINVSFAPTVSGALTGSLAVTDNTNEVAGSTQTVTLSGTGTTVVLSASSPSLSFGNQSLNTTSAVQPETITNTGSAALTFTAIAATGDFAVATTGTTCSTSAPVAPAGTCVINVTFSPTATGSRSGSLMLTDNATGSPQTIGLSGTGTAPAVSLSSSSLTFAAQISQTTSAAQSITVTNTGTANLTFTAIGVSGPFAVAASGTTCSTANPVAASGTCTVAVTFTPVAGGAASGSLSLTDNAPGSPHTVTLSGTGQDFSFAPPSGSSSTASVAPGAPANYTLSIGGQGGLSGMVNFTCLGAPSEAVCTVSPNPATAGNTPTPVTVTVTTTAASVGAPRSRPLPPVPPTLPDWRGLMILALALAAMSWVLRRRRQLGVSRWKLAMASFGTGLLLTLALAGCGGGSGGGGGGTPSNPGTPAGTYSLIVTGTVGSGASALSHNVSLTLTVT